MTGFLNHVSSSKSPKTVCMRFSKQSNEIKSSGVFLRGEELQLVTEFKYLGVTLDSTLSFKNHIKKLANTVKFNLKNFKQIRPFLTLGAARMFLHSMILSHIEYCITSWSLTTVTNFKIIESLSKKNLLKSLTENLILFMCAIS